MKANELMEQVTERVIRSIEEGLVTGKWTKPWQSNETMRLYVPTNVITKKRYSGANFLILAWLGQDHGFDSGIWGTYKQWESIGKQVAKGSTGIRCIKWVEKKCKDHGPNESCHSCGQMFPSVFTVFNECQLTDYERQVVDPYARIVNSDKPVEEFETFFGLLGGKVNHFPLGMAYYQPATDEIFMPEFEDFIDAGYYYSTLSHEFAHWTGHASRLNREGVAARSRDVELYAKEELVAELAATMLCAVLGIEEHPREDHAQYLQTWLQHLSSDKWALFKAASQATKATEYLLALGKLGEQSEDLEEVAS